MQKLLLVYYHSENPKSRHKPNLENTSEYGFSPDLGGKNGGVLSMRMQVILDSSFTRPGSAEVQPLYGAGRKESSGTGLGFTAHAWLGLYGV